MLFHGVLSHPLSQSEFPTLGDIEGFLAERVASSERMRFRFLGWAGSSTVAFALLVWVLVGMVDGTALLLNVPSALALVTLLYLATRLVDWGLPSGLHGFLSEVSGADPRAMSREIGWRHVRDNAPLLRRSLNRGQAVDVALSVVPPLVLFALTLAASIPLALLALVVASVRLAQNLYVQALFRYYFRHPEVEETFRRVTETARSPGKSLAIPALGAELSVVGWLFQFHAGAFWEAVRLVLVLIAVGTALWFAVRIWDYARHRGGEVNVLLRVRRGILFGAHRTPSEALEALREELRAFVRADAPLQLSDEVIDAILGLPRPEEDG